MNKIITFEQAKRLQALEISIVSDCGYVGYTKSGELVSRRKFKEDIEYQTIPCWIRVFTVSEALDWIREEKGIMCYVEANSFMAKGDNRLYTGGWRGVIVKSRLEDYLETDLFDTHSLASSALLDNLLTYLENK